MNIQGPIVLLMLGSMALAELRLYFDLLVLVMRPLQSMDELQLAFTISFIAAAIQDDLLRQLILNRIIPDIMEKCPWLFGGLKP